jgi:hypothetical protein
MERDEFIRAGEDDVRHESDTVQDAALGGFAIAGGDPHPDEVDDLTRRQADALGPEVAADAIDLDDEEELGRDR